MCCMMLGPLAWTIALIMVLGTSASQARPALYVNGNASALSYKILQLADVHISGNSSTICEDAPRGMAPADCTEALTMAFMKDLLDCEQPDFVVFSGDNVQTYGPPDHQAAIDNVTSAVENLGIPYAMIFGNHDDEGGLSREKIVRLVSKKKHSYTESGPEDVDGVGNYVLNFKAPIDGAWGAKGDDVLRMYFLDSGAKAHSDEYPFVFSEYDWIRESQIKYYGALSATGRESSGGVLLPAIMFFHIPLFEFEFSASGCHGEHHDRLHNQGVNLRLLSAVAKIGEVKTIFVGHDHLNEYCCLKDGIQLCYSGGTGFGRAYGSPDFTRRARVIEWSVDHANRREIRSWKRHWGDVSVVHSEEVLYTETSGV